jgi:hypothetical protein
MVWESLFGDLGNIPEGAQPLGEHGFRYDAKSRCWRSGTPGKNGMPLKAGAKSIAKTLGVAESLLREWEESYLRQWCSPPTNPAADSLRVSADGVVNRNPLLQWNLQYFPASQIWRRARAARDEVPREKVAAIVGVEVSLIEAWEHAMTARAEAKSPK